MTNFDFEPLLLIQFLLPGFVFQMTRVKLGAKEPEKFALLNFFVTGIGLALFIFPLMSMIGVDPVFVSSTEKLSQSMGQIYQRPFAWIFQVFLIPICLALFFVAIENQVKKAKFPKHLGFKKESTRTSALQAAISEHKHRYPLLRIVLLDGKVIYGMLTASSIIESDSDEMNLFLSTVYYMNKGKLELDRMSSGVYIKGKEIRYISFLLK